MGVKVQNNADGSVAWWSMPTAGWSEASEALFKHWHRFDRSTPKLDDEVAMQALSFGYAARSAYGEHKLWADLAPLLEADWQELDQGEHPWDTVLKVVKEGWAGAANLEPITGESMSAEPLPVVPTVEANVPGGRPNR